MMEWLEALFSGHLEGLSQVMVLDFSIPWSELRWTFSRAGGPGGQNVNKVSSKATLHWNVVGTEVLPADVKTRLLEQQRNRINAHGELNSSTANRQ
jgi:protein subunit release factor B